MALTKTQVRLLLEGKYKVPVSVIDTILANYPDDGMEPREGQRPLVESKKEAFALFEEYRAGISEIFRETAFVMLKPPGAEFTARDVVNQMKADGTYVDLGNDKWSGAAFEGDSRFEQCEPFYQRGEAYSVAKAAGRRAHGAYWVFKWKLSPTARAALAPVPAKEELVLA